MKHHGQVSTQEYRDWRFEAGVLSRYFTPPLTDLERATADREGWILGVM